VDDFSWGFNQKARFCGKGAVASGSGNTRVIKIQESGLETVTVTRSLASPQGTDIRGREQEVHRTRVRAAATSRHCSTSHSYISERNQV
jgi:hypothetical protein